MANFGWAYGIETENHRNQSYILLLKFILGVPLAPSFGLARVACCVGSVSPKCRDSHRIEDAPRPLHPLTRWGKSQHPWALVNKKYFFTNLDGFLMQMARVRLKAGLT